MFNIDESVEKTALEIVMGTKTIPSEYKLQDRKLWRALSILGIATIIKDAQSKVKIVKGGYKNFLHGMNKLTKEQVQDFQNLKIDEKFNILESVNKNHTVIIKKYPKESICYVISLKQKIIGEIVCTTDSRSPWFVLNGDERPYELFFTYKHMCENFLDPTKPYKGWGKGVNGKWMYYNIPGYFFNTIIKYLMEKYFEKKYDDLYRTINISEKFHFLDLTTTKSGSMEIVKSSGDMSADIYVGECEVGKITLSNKTSSAFSLMITMNSDIDEILPEGVDRYTIQKDCWDIVLGTKTSKKIQKPTSKFNPTLGEAFGDGKKQFQLS